MGVGIVTLLSLEHSFIEQHLNSTHLFYQDFTIRLMVEVVPVPGQASSEVHIYPEARFDFYAINSPDYASFQPVTSRHGGRRSSDGTCFSRQRISEFSGQISPILDGKPVSGDCGRPDMIEFPGTLIYHARSNQTTPENQGCRVTIYFMRTRYRHVAWARDSIENRCPRNRDIVEKEALRGDKTMFDSDRLS